MLFMAFACFYTSSNAQLGVISSLASGLITSRPQAKLKKHFFLTAQTTGQFGFSNIVPGSKSKTLIPPTFLTAEYGIKNNITLGAFIGLSKTKTRDILSYNSTDLQNIIDNIISGNPSTATSTGATFYEINYTLIGGSLKYNFNGGPKTNLYVGSRMGYKLSNKNTFKTGTGTSDPRLDDLLNVIETTNKFLFSGMFGINFFVDKYNRFALTPELGFGTGWGDGISIGTQSALLSVGLTYHLAPKIAPVSK